MAYDRLMLARMCGSLSVVVLLAARGGSATRPTTPQRAANRGNQIGVAQPEVLQNRRLNRKLTPADYRSTVTDVIKFMNAHCPCTLESTASGLNVVHERHH
jgi:hypothetical protein